MSQTNHTIASAVGVLLTCSTALLAQTTLPSNIDDTSFGPLKSGITYVVNNDVSVTSGRTLTIEPGAIIKFAAATSEFFVRNGATLNAVGTQTNPIVFTSIHDDSVGAKLSTRAPLPADWDDLEFDTGGGGSLRFVEVRYAGRGNDPSVVLANTSVAIRDCLVRDGAGDGIQARGTPTIERCEIRDCSGFAIDRVTFANLPNILDNTATGSGPKSMRVTGGTISGAFDIGPRNGLRGEIYIDSTLEIRGVTSTLALRPGLILKLISAVIVSGGAKMFATGSSAQPILFTSLNDDSVGNDTLGDGVTTGSPGDWIDVRFNSPGSTLDFCQFRFAGRQATPAAVRPLSGSFRMSDCIVEQCLTGGISCISSDPAIERCTIRDCGGQAINGVRLDSIPRFTGNMASNCAGGATLFTTFRQTGTAPLSVSATIGPDNLLGGEFVASSVDARGLGVTLTLEAGTILKLVNGMSTSQNATIVARGTSAKPVVITSTLDDTVGNDALGDGPTVGSPGDWSFVNLTNTGSTFEFVNFRFGGRGFSNGANIVVQTNVGATFRNCIIEQSSQYGINFVGIGPRNGEFAVENCAFKNNAQRAILGLDWREVPALLDNTASGNGGGDQLFVDGERSYTDVSVVRRNTLNGDGVISCVGVSSSTGQRFVAGPGLTFKMRGGSFINAAGHLALEGRGDAPIVVTSVKDDSYGGDTNLDGSSSMPQPGDWGLIRFENRGTVTGSIAHVHARFGGGGFSTSSLYSCNNDRIRITSARADYSKTAGFLIDNVMSPAANWIAYKCGRVGIQLLKGNFVLQHATSTENTGVGIAGAGAYTGTVYSSISWNNARGVTQDNFVTIRHTKCNGSKLDGNIHADPLFVDVQNGDLHIDPTSLCVGRGDLPQATLWGIDFDGNSRILDHTENGLALPDIGAYEVFRHRMEWDSELRLGKTTKFKIVGPGSSRGFQVVFIGPGVGGMFLPPFGVLITGTLATSTILFAHPARTPFEIAVPDDPNLAGVRIGIQTLIIHDLSLPAGGITNAFLTTISR
ncbi:MAG: hypothetical protein KDC95_14005 [Planctomycetes bacterium]|nr:hypothetical protein [Planctomycetota bacterium]